MKTKIYFVRHAEPDFSVKDDMIRPLTERGTKDTKKVTSSLIDKDITYVYSSPFKRAVDTIKDFAETMNFEIKIDNDFRERIIGEWVEDFKAFSKTQWEDFEFKILHGESLKEVQERNIAALLRVIDNHYGENIAIGTHGTALCTLLNYFDPNFGYEEFWDMVDKMPYILCFNFDGSELEKIEEIEVI